MKPRVSSIVEKTVLMLSKKDSMPSRIAKASNRIEKAKLNWRKIFNQAISRKNEHKNMAFGNLNTLGGIVLEEDEEESYYPD